MAERPPPHKTLREMLVDAERLTREFSEHLDQSFIPKCHELTRLVRPINGEPPDVRTLEDVTVRTQSAKILETDQYTESVFEQLVSLCQAIDHTVNKIISEG